MAYLCYVRAEGRDVVEVEPTVTIRFDQITTITRNRMQRVLQDNYNPYGWGSKPSAILAAMQEHYKVFTNLLVPDLINHSDFDKEMFAAKALLLGYKFNTAYYSDQNPFKYRYGTLKYIGDKDWYVRPAAQMNQLTRDTLLPIARKLIDHDKLAPILEALENRQPYTFTGVNMK